MTTELVPHGIQWRVDDDGKYGPAGDRRVVDPVLPYRLLSRPSEGGPLLVGGHTPGCRNAYGGAIDDNIGADTFGKPIATNGVGCRPSECECQGKEAEG